MSKMAEKFNALQPTRKNGLAEWVEALDKEDRAAFDAKAGDKAISANSLIILLRSLGCSVTTDSLRAWRNEHYR